MNANTSIRAAKRALRPEIRQRIIAMDSALRAAQEAELLQRFREGDVAGLASATTVLLYLSAFPEELDTWPMARWVSESGKRLILPRVDVESRLLRLHDAANLDDALVVNRWGIAEPSADAREVDPSAVEWALIPGLAFDTRGYRLGRGAGHYDRLLLKLPSKTPRWAWILDSQWVDEVPIEPHDQPIDGIVSPSRIIAIGD